MTTSHPSRPYPTPRAGDARRVEASCFPALRALLRGYLHEDYPAEYGSASSAVAAFAQDAQPAERRAVMLEWQRFSAMTQAWSIGDLRRALTLDLGSAWQPATRRDVDRAFARLTRSASSRPPVAE